MKIITFLVKRWRWLLALAFIIYSINIIFYNINNRNQHKNQKSDSTPYYIVNDTTTPSYSNYDSLPCNRIMQIKDSLKYVEDCKKMINDGNNINGTWGDEFWGYAYVSDPNKKSNGAMKLITPSLFHVPENETRLDTRYFIMLKSFELKDSSGTDNYPFYHKTFVENNNKYYIKSLAKDSINEGILICHYVYKEIPVKYIAKDKMLLFPVSYKWYELAIIGLDSLQFIFPFAFFYFVLLLSIKTIISISKGTPFTETNIRNLRYMAYYLMALPFFYIAIKMLIYQVFINRIPKEFEFNVNFNINYFISGVIVLIIAKAFQRGHDLQKEQELTI